MSCAGTYIHVWSINGNPIVSVNTFTGRSQQIVCCCVSEMNEWDTQNVIVTGHSDGVVRVSDLREKATCYPHACTCVHTEEVSGGRSASRSQAGPLEHAAQHFGCSLCGGHLRRDNACTTSAVPLRDLGFSRDFLCSYVFFPFWAYFP